ncbi:MAG: hypothetical protein KME06_12320 [Kastovskya adunca ATA6-11-RM4]|jgi:NO-binding membrane sensor protein with MHYT domain|nr:hypothetical protein [Kastovskya adunca ATA6-11-RM4]
MPHTYDLRLVGLSIIIAVFASYTAINLAERVTASEERSRDLWLMGGASAMGMGIWAMHFVGMLAFCLPIPIAYNLPIVLVSLLTAIVGSLIALFWVSRPTLNLLQLISGSVFMGGAIASMHYTAMAAMQVRAIVEYHLLGVTLSILIAIGVSGVGLWLIFQLREEVSKLSNWRQFGGATIMGLAIPIMHYTAMAAVTFIPGDTPPPQSRYSLDTPLLATAIGVVTLLILAMVMLVVVVSQHIAHKNAKAAEAAIAQKQKLEQTLQHLQGTQAQLIQAEKMSALGQLIAEIAHEINNPITFVHGNLDYVDEYTQAILKLLHLYQQQLTNPSPEIASVAEEIELDFIKQDLPKLLSSMQVGLKRIQQLVFSLKNFSRLDEAKVKPVNIQEGIDSSLLILQHRFKPKGKFPGIEVIKKYSELPLVECYPEQLNQVFLNLIGNAIDALETREEGRAEEENQLIIETKLLDSDREDPSKPACVLISIADNGTGMTENVKRRLFEPFFTTKPAGKGTGLGLSISYQIIVERHGGELQCHSEPGKGTEFFIKIPLGQPESEPAAIVPAERKLVET